MNTQTAFIKNVRKDFPILKKKIKGKPLVYLDNSATSLTPKQVVKAMDVYYTNYRANVHRSLHTLGEQATEAFIDAHKKVAAFINASSWKEIIFTRGTTDSFNLLARSLALQLQKGDEIVLTQMEHHSNLVPWQKIAEEKECTIQYIRLNENGELDEKSMKEVITKKTKIVAVTHISNVLGVINDIKKIVVQAHEVGAYGIVDAAQSIPHIPIDVQEINCDFLCFSGHKMYGPTGIGVLYGKKELLEKMEPVFFGGDMISEVTFTSATWNELPWKFEAGTPDIAGAIGLGAAVEYMQKLTLKAIMQHEEELTHYALEQLQKIPGITLYGPKKGNKRIPVFSFSIQGVHAHDSTAILDREGIAVRGGHLCAMPLVQEVLKVNDVCRASFAVYNTKQEVDSLIKGIKKVKEIFGV